MRPTTATTRLSVRPIITPRQQPRGPPFTSPCASGGSDTSGDGGDEGFSGDSSVVRRSEEGGRVAPSSDSAGFPFSSGMCSKCSKLAVSGVTQTWQDIPTVVQAIIECRNVDVNIGMGLRQLEQAIGCCDDPYVRETGNAA